MRKFRSPFAGGELLEGERFNFALYRRVQAARYANDPERRFSPFGHFNPRLAARVLEARRLERKLDALRKGGQGWR